MWELAQPAKLPKQEMAVAEKLRKIATALIVNYKSVQALKTDDSFAEEEKTAIGKLDAAIEAQFQQLAFAFLSC